MKTTSSVTPLAETPNSRSNGRPPQASLPPERYSTRKSYLSNINQYIKPRWGEYLIGAIRPMAAEGWFKERDKSLKTKVHIGA